MEIWFVLNSQQNNTFIFPWIIDTMPSLMIHSVLCSPTNPNFWTDMKNFLLLQGNVRVVVPVLRLHSTLRQAAPTPKHCLGLFVLQWIKIHLNDIQELCSFSHWNKELHLTPTPNVFLQVDKPPENALWNLHLPAEIFLNFHFKTAASHLYR